MAATNPLSETEALLAVLSARLPLQRLSPEQQAKTEAFYEDIRAGRAEMPAYLAAAARAPLVEREILKPEQRAEADALLEDYRAGRGNFLPHEEFMAWLEANRPAGVDWPGDDEAWPEDE